MMPGPLNNLGRAAIGKHQVAAMILEIAGRFLARGVRSGDSSMVGDAR